MYNRKEGTSLFSRISVNRNCLNQKVKFGCSCKTGKKEQDDDNYEAQMFKINSMEKPIISYINL